MNKTVTDSYNPSVDQSLCFTASFATTMNTTEK
jgi:hypothetical protein